MPKDDSQHPHLLDHLWETNTQTTPIHPPIPTSGPPTQYVGPTDPVPTQPLPTSQTDLIHTEPVSPPTRPITRSQNGIFKPRIPYGLSAQTSPKPTQNQISPIPVSHKSAILDPHWNTAMNDEYSALIRNNTWKLVPRPERANVIQCQCCSDISIGLTVC